VADHPLRPATDRRLGRPLPHQQANRTQAPLQATCAFDPQVSCGISRSFPRLSPTQRQIPTRYSPVRHCRTEARPCDLHVLSMPPAFALSQDQTLRFISTHRPFSPRASTNRPKPNCIPTLSRIEILQSVLSRIQDTSNSTPRRKPVKPKSSNPTQTTSPPSQTQLILPYKPQGRRQRIPS